MTEIFCGQLFCLLIQHLYWFLLFFKVAAGIISKGERDDTFNKTEVEQVV
jgi:hypothetical protein